MSSHVTRFIYSFGRAFGKLLEHNVAIRSKVRYLARGIYFILTGSFPEEEIRNEFIIKENINTIISVISRSKEEKCLLKTPLPTPFWYNKQYSSGIEPLLAEPVSQFCTQSQFEEPIFIEWCKLLKEPHCYHRKLWEYVYIMQALQHYGYLESGKKGLGFGVGREQLPALMANFGCAVTATDLDADSFVSKQWAATGQHSASVNQLNLLKICPDNIFLDMVEFRFVDMNSIPTDLNNFDFIWSSCALEHLGPMKCCVDFILNSLECLAPGGIAIHTTEFNLSSNTVTTEDAPTVLFRYSDIENIAKAIKDRNCNMEINFKRGVLPLDNYVDYEPLGGAHLNLMSSGYVSTSFGIIIHKHKHSVT